MDYRTDSIVNEEGRIIVVGDVHGCYNEVLDLFDVVGLTSHDKVIFVGDIVDRGPDSGLACDIAMSHFSVMGNHEEKHLKYLAAEASGVDMTKVDMPKSHVKTRSEISKRHYEWFATLPHVIKLPQYSSVVVHAGVFPGVSLDMQNKRDLTRLQYVNPELSRRSYWASKRPVGSQENLQDVRPNDLYLFWTNYWRGPERIIFGHSVLDQPLVADHCVGIDGGCVFGGELWAWVLPEEKIYRVPSRAPRRAAWVGYDVMNGVKTF